MPVRAPRADRRVALLPDEGETDAAGGAKGIRVTVYACGNCGYVRLHSANVLGDAAS